MLGTIARGLAGELDGAIADPVLRRIAVKTGVALGRGAALVPTTVAFSSTSTTSLAAATTPTAIAAPGSDLRVVPRRGLLRSREPHR